MAIIILAGEKKLYERVEHVEGIRYEIVMTSHAVYLERQVSMMSQWVGGMLLAIFLHIIGTVVQYLLLRRAHENVRIPWRNLRSTGIRRVPRHMILLLGIAIAIVLPLVLAFVGGVLSSVAQSPSLAALFGVLAAACFFIACVATVALLIRFPRTAFVLGGDWRDHEFHSLGDENAVREIAERMIVIQEKVIGSSNRDRVSASSGDHAQRANTGSTPASGPAPIPGPQSRR